MGMYRWISILSADDFSQLAAALAPEFGPDRVVQILRDGINSAVQGVLIEDGYVDKDYRSTYYHFYSKMGRPYRADCVRLHFFDSVVTFDPDTLDLLCADRAPNDHYFGYMVLRPTMVATIGRTVMSSDVRMGARGQVIHALHKVHLLGHKLHWYGFPSMDQHADIAVCAHVACWSILRHYSELYSQHRELLVHDITLMAHQFDPGGLVPANGLDVFEAERVFQAAGTYPLLVSKNPKSPQSFYRQLLAYLDSGFPLFVAMEKTHGHAVVAIGRSWRSETPEAPPLSGGNAWDRVETVTVIDDNYLPYRNVPAAAITGAEYTAESFDRFIVPLPEKIFYPASAVDKQAASFATLLRKVMDMPAPDDTVVRYFVTTVSALRGFARANGSQLGVELVALIMQLQTTQFVWIVEYASTEQWARGEISARSVLDASASPQDSAVAWMAHGRNTAIFLDRSIVPAAAKVIALSQLHGAPLSRMESNLRPVKQRT